MLGQGEREVVRLLFLHGALVGAGLDLVEQDTARPAKLRRGAQVEKAGGGVSDLVENQKVMTPRNLCDKLPQNSIVAALIQFGHSLWPKLALAEEGPLLNLATGCRQIDSCGVSKIEALHVPHDCAAKNRWCEERCPADRSTSRSIDRLAPSE